MWPVLTNYVNNNIQCIRLIALQSLPYFSKFHNNKLYDSFLGILSIKASSRVYVNFYYIETQHKCEIYHLLNIENQSDCTCLWFGLYHLLVWL